MKYEKDIKRMLCSMTSKVFVMRINDDDEDNDYAAKLKKLFDITFLDQMMSMWIIG